MPKTPGCNDGTDSDLIQPKISFVKIKRPNAKLSQSLNVQRHLNLPDSHREDVLSRLREEEINYQKFNQNQLYKSYIKYAEDNGGLHNFRLEFDHASAFALRTKVNQSHLTKPRDFEPVDHFYATESLNDETFVTRYQRKWGTERKDFLPVHNRRPIIDSHSTLTKVDQARVNNILNRNISLYYNYAVDQLANGSNQSSSRNLH